MAKQKQPTADHHYIMLDKIKVRPFSDYDREPNASRAQAAALARLKTFILGEEAAFEAFIEDKAVKDADKEARALQVWEDLIPALLVPKPEAVVALMQECAANNPDVVIDGQTEDAKQQTMDRWRERLQMLRQHNGFENLSAHVLGVAE